MKSLHKINKFGMIPVSIKKFVEDWPMVKYLWVSHEEILYNLTRNTTCRMENILDYKYGYTSDIPSNLYQDWLFLGKPKVDLSRVQFI